MNEDGQDFETLRRALALKRHETPPPRYFNELPGRILRCLDESSARVRPSFWRRFAQLLGERPVYATGAGVAAGCAVLAAAGWLAIQDAAVPGTAASLPEDSPNLVADTVFPGGLKVAAPVSLAESNRNAGTELFNSFQPQALPASAKLPGN